MVNKLLRELNQLKNKEKIEVFKRFFKTGKGEYGEGDRFLGLTVPQIRKISKKYFNKLNLEEIQQLLKNKVHEVRLAGLLILRFQYEKASKVKKEKIVCFYLDNTLSINNWDLVDLSCQYILGDWLLNNKKDILYNLVKSKNLWERRIAIVSTFAFIKKGQFKDTLKLAKILINDSHNLIHKAVGWMLREVGKRDKELLKKFLEQNSKDMPRAMLRYAIEKFGKGERRKYLKKIIN